MQGITKFSATAGRLRLFRRIPRQNREKGRSCLKSLGAGLCGGPTCTSCATNIDQTLLSIMGHEVVGRVFAAGPGVDRGLIG